MKSIQKVTELIKLYIESHKITIRFIRELLSIRMSLRERWKWLRVMQRKRRSIMRLSKKLNNFEVRVVENFDEVYTRSAQTIRKFHQAHGESNEDYRKRINRYVLGNW